MPIVVEIFEVAKSEILQGSPIYTSKACRERLTAVESNVKDFSIESEFSWALPTPAKGIAFGIQVVVRFAAGFVK